MVLEPDDRRLFYRLLWHLLYYTGHQLEVLPRPASPAAIESGPGDQWVKLREMLYQNPALFDRYADENPDRFTEVELAEVRSWRHFLRSDFLFLKQLKHYAVFLDSADPGLVFGVVAPNKPFALVYGRRPPIAVQTVLLPFRGRIVYDGLTSSWDVTFGPGIRSALTRDYRAAKERFGVITSLPRELLHLGEGRPR
jgi:hypothetical protein